MLHKMSHLDADQAFFFNRSLEHIRAQAYRTQYPDLLGRVLVPVNNDISNGADVYTARIYDQTGQAAIGSNFSSQSPRADVVSKEAFYPIRSIRGSYAYSIQDVRASILSGQDLPQERANAARSMIERAIDDMIFFGSKITGVYGLTNNPDTLSVTCGTAWASATVAEIVEDMQEMVDKIGTETKEVEKPDTFAIAPSLYRIVNARIVADTNGKTILEWFKMRNPGITVIVADKLAASNPSSKPQIIVYQRNIDKLEAVIPQEFEQLAPQDRGMESLTECHARCGGTAIKFPKSVLYGTGMA